jgi:Fe-Mn family superoxide dismutase
VKFELPPLPYSTGALEPHISSRTLEFHYDKHHRGYLTKLEDAISGTPDEKKSLEEIFMSTEEPKIFNPAAQVWNHTFYWSCLSPDEQEPSETLVNALNKDFGSVDEFKQRLATVAAGQFGSGWAWLVLNPNNRLSIEATPNAENPLTRGQTPLFTIDVWEHAYYLDYQHERGSYIKLLLDHLINWQFIDQNLQSV